MKRKNSFDVITVISVVMVIISAIEMMLMGSIIKKVDYVTILGLDISSEIAIFIPSVLFVPTAILSVVLIMHLPDEDENEH